MRRYFTLHDPVLPVHHPRVLVQVALEQGADQEALFDGTGLALAMFEVPETRINYMQMGALATNALRLTQNPALGLDVGRRLHLPQMGVLGLAIMSSPTIGDALAAVMRQLTTLAPALEVDFRLEEGRGCLALEHTIPLGRLAIFTNEMALAAFDTQGRFLLGKPLPVLEIRSVNPRPAHFERYREMYDVPYLFEQTRTEVIIDAGVLSEVIPYADPNTARLAERSHAQLFPPAAITGGLIGQVKQVLAASDDRAHELEEVARRLQTSGRSLRRALQEMGTSFQELRDDSRRERALEWARTTDMTFEEVAHRLGFSDVRSFRRAFKRWTGELPGEVRRKAREA